MNPALQFDHIADLETVEPVGAVLVVGRKSSSLVPIDTDRFFFSSPRENEQKIRPPLESFRQFNEAPAEKRRTIRGNLVHATRQEAWIHNLKAMQLGSAWKAWPKMSPSKRPVCSGDGERALRLYGVDDSGNEDWREIECPNRLCEFQQSRACKSFGRLYFRPRWQDGSKLPSPLTKITTQSIYSVLAFEGMFRYVENQARQLGLTEFSLYGLPFVLTLSRKTQPSQKRAFPVMELTPDCDLIEFFLEQRRRILEAGGQPTLRLAASNQSSEEIDDAEIASDIAAITPGAPIVSPAHPTVDLDEPTEPERSGGLLSNDAMRRIRQAASDCGVESVDSLIGGPLDEAPASAELEILASIRRKGKR